MQDTLTTSTSPARSTIDERRRTRTDEIFDECRVADEATRAALLDEVVRINMRIADQVAFRFAGRGLATDDLRQVAYLALVKAAQRFDPDNGSDFLAYAVPTMRGEVRKHFRDAGWMIRPTRRVQEAQARSNAAIDALTSELGRSPRPSEVAERTGEPLDLVIEAMGADGCFVPTSLDTPTHADREQLPLGALLGGDDPGMAEVETRATLVPSLKSLDERDQLIVHLRFVEELTQREIAEQIGVTQMTVSRLLSRILRDLRRSMGEVSVA